MVPSIFFLSFYDGILTSAIALNDFSEGKSIMVKLNDDLLNVKGVNRLVLTKNYMVLSFRTENYSEAFHLYQKTVGSNLWRKAAKQLKEPWELYGAYLFFLNEIKVLNVPDGSFKDFRMARFFNSLDFLNKDKIGYNLAILILQVIYFLKKKNYDRVLDHLESLKSYNYRYLRKNESARSQYFVKMLLTLSEGNFHLEAVKRKSSKWSMKLNKEKSSVSNEELRAELIPYNVLWKIILDQLDRKIRNSRRNFS